MVFIATIKARIKKITMLELGVMKVCLFAFTLLAAKLCPVLLSLEWGWYAAVFTVTYAYLVYFFLLSSAKEI